MCIRDSDQLLGRVNSVYRLLAWGTMPIGALLGGVLGELFGLEIVFVVGAVLIALLLLAREVLNDDVLDAAEREAEEGRLARAQTDTTKPPLAPPTAPPV